MSETANPCTDLYVVAFGGDGFIRRVEVVEHESLAKSLVEKFKAEFASAKYMTPRKYRRLLEEDRLAKLAKEREGAISDR